MSNQGYTFAAPPLTRVNKWIIIITAGLFILNSLLQLSGVSLSSSFALSAAGFWSGHLYQIITHALFQNGLMDLVFGGLVIWFIGAELERIWTSLGYILFAILSTMVSGLIYVAIGLFLGGVAYTFPFLGFTAFTSGLLVAFATLYPNTMFSFMFFFPMKAKYFCMLLAGIQVYMGIFTPMAVQAWPALFAMGFAWFFTRYNLMNYLLVLISKFHLPRQPKKLRKSSHLRVVGKEEVKDENSPRYWQ